MNARPGGLQRYYDRFFVPLAADAVCHVLATCGRQFELRQREVVLFCAASSGREYPSRHRVYHELREVLDDVSAPPGIELRSISFGPIYPGHWLAQQPTRPAPLWPCGNNVLDVKPREHERAHAIRDGNACAYGELVLDVDLESHPSKRECYDRTNICRCGTARRVCDTCWAVFMDPAQQALLWALRDFCGYRRVFCVFSGRRGFHIWVCDDRVIHMTQPERVALVEMLRAPTAGEGDPFTDGMYAILAPAFDANARLRARYFRAPADPHARRDAHRAAVFAALWPRIDVPVAADATHLHKVPLVLHPETAALCVVMGEANKRFVPSADTIVVHESSERVVREAVSRGAQRIYDVFCTTVTPGMDGGGSHASM